MDAQAMREGGRKEREGKKGWRKRVKKDQSVQMPRVGKSQLESDV